MPSPLQAEQYTLARMTPRERELYLSIKETEKEDGLQPICTLKRGRKTYVFVSNIYGNRIDPLRHVMRFSRNRGEIARKYQMNDPKGHRYFEDEDEREEFLDQFPKEGRSVEYPFDLLRFDPKKFEFKPKDTSLTVRALAKIDNEDKMALILRMAAS